MYSHTNFGWRHGDVQFVHLPKTFSHYLALPGFNIQMSLWCSKKSRSPFCVSEGCQNEIFGGNYLVRELNSLCFLRTSLVGMLKDYIMCLDFILRHNISSTLPLKCIPTQKIRKFCCALICGQFPTFQFPALSLNLKFEFGYSSDNFSVI